MEILLISLLTFVFTGIIVYALLRQLAPEGFDDGRIKALDSMVEERVDIDLELSKPFAQRVLIPMTQKFAASMSRLTPNSIRKLIENKLNMAGGFGGFSADQFLVLSVGAAIIFGVATILLGGFVKVHGNKLISYVVIAGEIGLLTPYGLLLFKVAKRKNRLQRDLADVLDLLTVSVEAGLGFDAALVKLSEKMRGPLVEEFSRVLQEMRMGVQRREAFRALSLRCNVPDITVFTSALIQADQLGASLANVLRVQSASMREVRRQRTEEKAQKAPVKMLIPLVFLIFPVIFIVLLGPAGLMISKSIIGK